MVKVNFKVAIAGMICLALIYSVTIICGKDGSIILTMISTVIGVGTGIMLPQPKVDKKGVLKW